MTCLRGATATEPPRRQTGRRSTCGPKDDVLGDARDRPGCTGEARKVRQGGVRYNIGGARPPPLPHFTASPFASPHASHRSRCHRRISGLTGLRARQRVRRRRATASGVPVAAPKLVVFITVDQLRGDMLDRYGSDLRHGYARLMRGAWFTAGTRTMASRRRLPATRAPCRADSPEYRHRRELRRRQRPGLPVAGAPNEPGASPERFAARRCSIGCTRRIAQRGQCRCP